MATSIAKSPDDVLPRVARGDAQAVSECLDRYGDLVWTLARRALSDRDAAEDAVQEIFVQLWEKASVFDPERGSEAAFVATIARRRLIDRVRRLRTRPDSQELGELEPAHDDAGLESVDVCDEARRAREALDELKPDHRKIVMLSVVQGLSHGEIAERLGVPLGTVKSVLRRAFERVRTLLARSDRDLARGGARA